MTKKAETYDYSSVGGRKKTYDYSSLTAEPIPEESTTQALLSAPYKIKEDVTRGIMDFANKVPEYIESAKTEIPGVIENIQKHPGHMGRQMLAGTNEMINNLAQTPLNISKYGSDRLNLLPKAVTNAIQKISPEDTTEAINHTFGLPEYPGENLVRGATRNMLNLAIGTNLATKFNPGRLANSSIRRDVLKAKNAAQKEYSAPGGHYDQLFKEAENKGAGTVKINPAQVDIDTISKHSTPKYYESTENLISNPSIRNAQKSISDLEKLSSKLESKTTLTDPERETLNAARNAKSHIKDNMFRDTNGNLHQDLADRHAEIQKGYKEDVVPYTTNTAIKKYLRRELSDKQLVKQLQNGKFNVQVGDRHMPLRLRNSVNNFLNSYLGRGLGLGVGGLGGAYGLSKARDFLLGNEDIQKGI